MLRSLVTGFCAAVLVNGVLTAQEMFAALPTRVHPAGDVSNAPAGNRANRWRYRFHNGRWWYYGQAKQWSYWDGAVWRAYNRQIYAPSLDSQWRPGGYDTNSYGYGQYRYGVRAPGSIQWEKNDPRAGSLQPFIVRPPGSIQRQKNSPRAEYEEVPDIRPPGTIQREKNSPRG